MCGIIGGKGIGVFENVEKNIQVLNRRGPDSQSFIKLNNDLVLGATRLAMTDPLPRSNQPLTDLQSGNMIIFNGEIYNYRKIRESLINFGIIFNTESDTEVLLKALTYFGIDIIKQLEGMFAFVFFNIKNNELVISRDYLGKKPLYYYLDKTKLFFSSQANLVQDFINETGISSESLSTYLDLGFIIDPNSMFQNVKAVMPGEIIVINIDDNEVKLRQNFIPEMIEFAEESNVRLNISNALEQRVHGHSKFALSLSGGIDSTILAIECSRLKLPVTAYSMRWIDSDKIKYNTDSTNAEKIAKSLNIDFEFVDMPNSAEISNVLGNYISAMGEPNSNPTGLSMMALYSNISRDGHRLVLTGDGADEVFGGYERYSLINKYKYLPQLNSDVLISIIRKNKLKNKFLDKVFSVLFGNKFNESWKYWHTITSENKLNQLFSDFNTPHIELLGSELSFIFGENRVSNVMYKDLRTWLSMESNRKLDRISMWYSIEARSPFQCERVIGHGLRSMQIENFSKLQKEILYSEYPELENLPINKTKLGFISPVGHWLRNNPDLIRSTLENLPKYLELNKKEFLKLTSAPFKRNFTDVKTLWSLVILNRWFMNQQ
jgi:asparagine synthase (glutamine-hydrolysing)